MSLRLFILALFTITSGSAFADYALFDNGEILPHGQFKGTLDSQFLLDHGGLNVGARFDAGINEDWGVRGLAGTGKTDMFFGAFGKWMPLKETDEKPTMGLNGGVLYLKDSGDRDFIIRAEPLIAKRLAVGNMFVTPYGSIPVGVRFRQLEEEEDKSDITAQLVVGSQLQLEQWQNLQFIAELGLNVANAPTIFGVAAVFYFDTTNGFSLNGERVMPPLKPQQVEPMNVEPDSDDN